MIVGNIIVKSRMQYRCSFLARCLGAASLCPPAVGFHPVVEGVCMGVCKDGKGYEQKGCRGIQVSTWVDGMGSLGSLCSLGCLGGLGS